MEGVSPIPKVHPHPEWKRLLERYRDVELGTVIKKEDIAVVLGQACGTHRYYSQVNRWKRHMLREEGKAIRVRLKVGYEVIAPDQYTEHSRWEALRGRRRYRQAVAVAKVAPVDRMSQKEAQKHANMMVYLAPLMRVLNKIEYNTRAANLLKPRPDVPKLKG